MRRAAIRLDGLLLRSCRASRGGSSSAVLLSGDVAAAVGGSGSGGSSGGQEAPPQPMPAGGGGREQGRAPPPPPPEHEQRLLSVAVVGLPNAGKSTLVNRLVGAKVSGVSSKRNTTTSPQLGAFTVGTTQVLLYDTPGLVDRRVRGSPLERLRSAWATAAAADQLLVIVDAERQWRLREPALLSLVQQLAAGPPGSMLQGWRRPPSALFLNKQDKLPAHVRATVLRQLQQQLCGAVPFEAVFNGAAMLGQGVEQLRSHLLALAPPGKWQLAPGQSHAATPGELALELVREKLFRRLNRELPYALATALEACGPAPGGGVAVRVSVTVRSQRVRSIVVGKGGEIIQHYVALPTQAELERILRVPVQLSVSVKVRDGG